MYIYNCSLLCIAWHINAERLNKIFLSFVDIKFIKPSFVHTCHYMP